MSRFSSGLNSRQWRPAVPVGGGGGSAVEPSSWGASRLSQQQLAVARDVLASLPPPIVYTLRDRPSSTPVEAVDRLFEVLQDGSFEPPAEELAKYWSDFINGHIPNFAKSPYDQLDSYVKECWEAIVETAVWAEKELPAVLDKIKPDLICIDNVILFPAAKRHGKPLSAHWHHGGPLTLPVPMFNIITGGRHAENSTDFQ